MVEIEGREHEASTVNSLTKEQWVSQNPLRMWRKRAKMTQADVASRLGVGLRAVAGWELGEVYPTGQNLSAIAELVDEDGFYRKWKEWYLQREMITD